MIVELPDPIERQISSEARVGYPYEVCGLLIGRMRGETAVIVRCESTPNEAEGDRRRRFAIAPDVLLNTQRRVRQEGCVTVGVYHSHPNEPARPSRIDLQQGWPELIYVICRVDQDRCGPITAWRLAVGFTEFEEIPIGRPVVDG